MGNGKLAIVTGASTGIGFELAHIAAKEGYDLLEPLASRQATVIAIGESRPLIAAALRGRVPVHEADDMSSAVRTAFASASPGQTVVLAPACASFDMFRDYAERGHAFKREVRRLAEEWNVMREQ